MKIYDALNMVTCKIPRKEAIAPVLESAIEAANPLRAIVHNLDIRENCLLACGEKYPITAKTRLVTIALGKAAPAMLQGASICLGDLIPNGVCVTKHIEQAGRTVNGIKYFEGNHPVPGEGSLAGGRSIQSALAGLTEQDIVLVLLSGGGSALATLPVEGVSIADLQQLTGVLLQAGVTITELNTVRKHLDRIKGGGLLRMAAPAQVIALVLSDVVGNPLDVIASGPAYPDESTFANALEIIDRIKRFGIIPESILQHLQRGASGMIPETLKPGDAFASSARNAIIGSNIDSCRAAVMKAREFGFHAEIVTDRLVGEARDAGTYLANVARESLIAQKPWMLVFGGETTVTVRGNGQGGRNQEVALAAVRGMDALEGRLLITLATDGEDGPTNAAGAAVDGTTLERAKNIGLDQGEYLNNNDANTYFKKIGDLLMIGPTGTNVNDISFLFGFD